ncbi:trimeric autotransporter adhesin [Paraburkholderia unamae]|uniref:ESPR-type extended signal peptide-containing protein n=1 Tax=Paraburkholderia unamae TaxID=219649 RepID=UPI000DC3AA69|nr:YadA-like family protein [Paraburkholderia unamae]RAR58277.1 trimeric autotransporter adhesin [Paraburkholderia unamae]
MNKIYRNVWNAITGTWVAAAETARGRGKGATKQGAVVLAALVLSSVGALDAAHAANGFAAGGGTVATQTGIAIDGSDSSTTTCVSGTGSTYASGTNSPIAIGCKTTATGDSAIALGAFSQALRDRSIAIGQSAKANAVGALALGAFTQAAGDQSVALGESALAYGIKSLSLGYDAKTYDNYAVALGPTSVANKDYALAIGSEARAMNTASIAFGGKSTATADNAMAIGNGSNAAAANSIALGRGANATADADVSVAVGYQASAAQSGVLALGSASSSASVKSSALGYGAKVEARSKYGTALGANAGVAEGAAYSVAVGGGMTSATGIADSERAAAQVGTGASYGVAIGSGAQVAANVAEATAVGSRATSAVKGGVALGAGSQASRVAGVAGYVQPGAGGADQTAVAATRSTSGALSVGDESNGLYRQITGVAAGSKATDAVNVAQLQATANQVTTLGDTVNQIDTSGTRYFKARGNGQQDDATAAGENSVAAGERSVAQGAGSVALGSQALAGSADAVALGRGAVASGYWATAVGSGASATGTGSIALGESAASGNWGTAIGTHARATGQRSVALGADADATKDDAVAVGRAASAAQNGVALGSYAQAAQNSVALGDHASATRGAMTGYVDGTGQLHGQNSVGELNIGSVDAAGQAGSRQITGVAAGTAATDAVNVAQLNRTREQVDENRQDIDHLKKTGQDAVLYDTPEHDSVTLGAGRTGPVRLANVRDGRVTRDSTDAINGSQLYGASESVANAIGGGSGVDSNGAVTAPTIRVNNTTYHNVTDAIENVDARTTTNTTEIANLTKNITYGTLGLVQQSDAGAPITVGKDTGGTRMDFSASGGDARQLSGVADGLVSAASLQAINGSQLHGVSESVANALGGGSYVKNDGTLFAPTYRVGGNTYQSVGGAIENIDGRVTTIESTVNNISTQIGKGEPGLVQQDASTGAITVGANTAGSTVDVSGTQGVRTVTGVADGEIASGSVDAINGAQLYALAQQIGTVNDTVSLHQQSIGDTLSQANAYTDQQVNSALQNSYGYTDRRIASVRRDASAGTAAAMAMAGLPQATQQGRGMTALAGSTYDGQAALALGVSRMSGTGKWVIKGSASTNTRGYYGFSVGAGRHW